MAAGSVAIAAIVLTVAALPEAHKPVTSIYTYNDEVFPILERHCAGCHVPGGIAPMSLVTYNDAYPWAESIKEEVVNLRMPPWHVDDEIGRVAGSRALSAREIDILLDWAWGGTPEGDPARRPSPVALDPSWPLGAPDAVLEPEEEGGLPADRSEGISRFTLARAWDDDRWVAAVDLRPGNPAIVRDATVWLVHGDTRQPLLLWVPGSEPARHAGAAFRLPGDATLELEVHYRKTWTYEGLATPDRTAVGLHWSEAAAPLEIRRVSGGLADAAVGQAGDEPVTFGLSIDDDLDALALAPDGQPARDVRVTVVRPDGSREEMIRFARTPADWHQTYAFDAPIPLPKGSRVEVSAWIDPDVSPAGETTGPRVWLDVVPGAVRQAAR